MAATGRLRVDGARELRAALKAAGRGVQDLKDVNREAAEIVADRARATAPEGPAPLHIRDTIRAAGTQSDAVVRVGNARMPYGKPLHWGHKTFGTARPVAAQPWVYLAAKDTSDRWLPRYLDHLDRIVRSVEGPTTP